MIPSAVADELLERLRAWKQATDLSEASDWIFASPLKLGRLPYSYTGIRRLMARAAKDGEIGHLTTHTFRHTYRTGLNATGTPIATQQKLMRHSTITMTMDAYGTVFDEEMSAASARVARLAFHSDSAQAYMERSPAKYRQLERWSGR
jgi:integrase